MNTTLKFGASLHRRKSGQRQPTSHHLILVVHHKLRNTLQ